MEVYCKKNPLTERISSFRKQGKTIGFVPTMGALHQGHLSLVNICRSQNDVTVVSIFVNPNQFNDKDDLKRYPRMPEKDSAMLESTGCDLLLMPDEKEIYPEPDTRIFDFGNLDKVMEGEHRPGHFNGVAQVVTRLFDIVKPDRAYFGQKDFQQVAIIKKVTSDLHYPIEIIPCPIVREPDGLAMSSRNMLLSTEERKNALALSRTLFAAQKLKDRNTIEQVRRYVLQQLGATGVVETEYFEIVNGMSLKTATRWDEKEGVIGCLAARVGKVRLIDNINFSL